MEKPSPLLPPPPPPGETFQAIMFTAQVPSGQGRRLVAYETLFSEGGGVQDRPAPIIPI